VAALELVFAYCVLEMPRTKISMVLLSLVQRQVRQLLEVSVQCEVPPHAMPYPVRHAGAQRTCSPALCIVVGQVVATVRAAVGAPPALPAAAAAAEVQALPIPSVLRRQPLGFHPGYLREQAARSATISEAALPNIAAAVTQQCERCCICPCSRGPGSRLVRRQR
jgi:hypothetical protein